MNKGRRRPLMLHFSCTKEEYEAIKARARQTTARSFTEYVRKMLMQKPVNVTYRNLSWDGLIDVLTEVQRTLDRLQQESRWGVAERAELLRLAAEIKCLIYKIAEQCMPK